MLLKSVKLNRNINNYYRAYAYAYIIRNKRKFKYLNYTQTCILSGRSKSVWSYYNIGRHKINELNRSGSLVNIKPASW